MNLLLRGSGWPNDANGEGIRPTALPMVEAWRGAAALMVVLAHWGGAAGWRDPLTAFAFVGVDLFFVISGFVFAPYVTGAATPDWKAFAIRRVMRLYPAYLVALGLYAGLSAFNGRPLDHLAAHLLMAHVQSREVAFYYNPAFWSLPSEVEFYLLVGVMGVALSGAVRQQAWAWLLGGALLLRLALVPAADVQGQNMAYLLVHHLPGLLVEFLLGTWAWTLSHRSSAVLRRWLTLGACGMAACVAGYWALETGPRGSQWVHGQMSLMMAACFAPVLAATSQWAPTSGLGAKACDWAGRLSYPMYLLHTAWTPLVGTALGVVGCAALMLPACLAMHLAVEEPARRWGRRVAARI
jgi:peptidoglycan/LPS O-acetylase OafA/YrhL